MSSFSILPGSFKFDGKRLHNYGKSTHVQWVNPPFLWSFSTIKSPFSIHSWGSFTRIKISQEPSWTLVATNLGHETCFVSCFPTIYIYTYIHVTLLYFIFYRSPQAWWGSATGYWASNQRSNNGRKFAMIHQLKWTFTKNLGLIRFHHSKIVFFPLNQFQPITLSRRSVSTGRWPDGIRRKDLCAKRTCEVGSGRLDSCKVLCCCWFLHNSSN